MTRAIYLKAGGGYDNVFLGNQDISDPINDEVQIRLHASSLNYHDYAVVSGVWGPSEQRIPMADGAGEVIKENNDGGSFLVNAKRIFSRLFKCYFLRKGYREGRYGFFIALCAGLYPIWSYLKAKK